MAGATRNCCHLGVFCVHHTTMHHVTSCKTTYVRCMRVSATFFLFLLSFFLGYTGTDNGWDIQVQTAGGIYRYRQRMGYTGTDNGWIIQVQTTGTDNGWNIQVQTTGGIYRYRQRVEYTGTDNGWNIQVQALSTRATSRQIRERENIDTVHHQIQKPHRPCHGKTSCVPARTEVTLTGRGYLNTL